jgi:hypothetical protein
METNQKLKEKNLNSKMMKKGLLKQNKNKKNKQNNRAN